MDDTKFFLKSVRGLSKFTTLRRTLKKNSILVLKGKSGTGATTLAKCLKRTFCVGKCRIVHIKKEKLTKCCQSTCYIITGKTIDPTGNRTLSTISMETFIIDKNITKLIVVVENDPPNLTAFITNIMQMGDPNCITYDVGGKDFYTIADKENILALQMKKYNVFFEDVSNGDYEIKHMSKSLFNDILEENPFQGFPSMCASFCSHTDHLRLGMQYIRQPPADLVSNLDQLRVEGESVNCYAIHYCLLVSVLLNTDNELSLNSIFENSFEKMMQKIYPQRENNFTTEEVKCIASYLMPEYINTDCNSALQFSHHTMYQAVLISYGRKHPLTVLLECKVGDVLCFIRPNNYRPLHDEMILQADYSSEDFVKRLTNSVMMGISMQDDIMKQLVNFTEKYEETTLLLMVEKEIKKETTFDYYTYESRILFFNHVAGYAHTFSNVFSSEIFAFSLSWEYVGLRKDDKIDELNKLKEQVLEYDNIEQFLHTIIDKHGNTLLHYFMIWGGNEEKCIVSNVLSKFEKNLIKDEDLAKLWATSNLKNKTSQTPLHFAAYFGRYDLLRNFMKIINIKRKNSKLFKFWNKVTSTLSKENATYKSMIELGRRNVTKRVKECEIQKDIVFETGLIPLNSPISFGESDEYEKIVSIISQTNTV